MGPSPTPPLTNSEIQILLGRMLVIEQPSSSLSPVYRVKDWDYFRILENLSEKGDYLPFDDKLIIINTK